MKRSLPVNRTDRIDLIQNYEPVYRIWQSAGVGLYTWEARHRKLLTQITRLV